MQYYLKKKQVINISYMLCSIFLLHMMVAPITNTFSIAADSRHGTYSAYRWKPLSKLGKLRITLDINEIEQLSDLAFIQTANRDISDYQRLLNRMVNAILLPVTGIVISINFIFCSFLKLVQSKSLMAFSMGGHAPPESLS